MSEWPDSKALFYEVNSHSSNLTYHLLKAVFVSMAKVSILTKTVHDSTSVISTKVLA